MELENEFVLTAYDHIASKVKFDVPKKTLLSIMTERNIPVDSTYGEADKDSLRLAYADIIKWFVLGPSKKNNVSDSDNGWSHSGGGYDMSDEDRRELKAEANAIYEELEPESAFKSKPAFRITSHGIKRAGIDAFGQPTHHIIR